MTDTCPGREGIGAALTGASPGPMMVAGEAFRHQLPGGAMGSVRRISKVWKSKPTVEGAGVHLKRAFGHDEVPLFDPFLLLDDFHSDRPQDYLKGFPWHPHRGIETITYVLAGRVEHGDSMGNEGVIEPGRRPVDDGRRRHRPPGDAEGQRGRPDVGLPALGQPAGLPQDDGAPLPGHHGASRSRR